MRGLSSEPVNTCGGSFVQANSLLPPVPQASFQALGCGRAQNRRPTHSRSAAVPALLRVVEQTAGEAGKEELWGVGGGRAEEGNEGGQGRVHGDASAQERRRGKEACGRDLRAEVWWECGAEKRLKQARPPQEGP